MSRPLDRTTIDAKPPVPEVRDALALTPGTRIEQYELIREVGKGGMGQVFLARDNKLGRRVAIKLLAAKNKQHAERFLVEARATARCAHENIVVIHEVDEHAGVPYMVLEYVEGATLAQLAREKRMAAGRAVELIVPVVRALAAAHAANIVHRDLKPDNIVVTQAGTVKVLDFGIASLGEGGPQSFAGTLPYMSPEQLGTEPVDARSDLWAVGILLFELLAGKHPLEPLSQGVLLAAAASPEPMPSLADHAPGLPDRLVAVVARCLEKKKAARYASAQELLADLEPLLPNRRALAAEDSPYPGLTTFQEADAAKFFGRSQDIAALVAKLRERPLVGLVGPSGVGKSSLLRAGVVPALKDAGESWEVIIVRPGRYPLTALASALEGLRDSRDSDPIVDADPAAKLRAEPGTFGARLRARARRRRSQILLFVDQLEELYTLVPDPAERAAFTACLTAAGDDAAGPLRVVVSMRSDFLDRAAEDRRFVEELTRGLVFLQPPNAAALEQALTQPLDLLGFHFEDGIVDAMVEALEQTPGALPLLQFSAARLWEQRDRQRRVLTREAYVAMGGVAGALASHADEVIARMSAADQRTARTLFQRLVTPERTRALVETSELRDISPDIARLVADLVEARLLVVHTRSGGAVELVHESLITSWPTLRRWLDENQDDAAYLAQVRAAAKQWDDKGRAPGLLWRDQALDEARLWRSRYTGDLPPREKDFLDAATALATRATRIRRAAALATIAVLLAVIAGGAYALVQIQHNKQLAQQQATAADKARRDAEAARSLAEQQKKQAQDALAAEEAARSAEQLAEKQKQAAMTDKQRAQQEAATQQLAAAKSKAAAAEAQQRLDAQKKAEAAAKKRRDRDGAIDKGGL
ncbi:MAG: protein kinase [Deltaproteobacteria bacterium]|nr:protein kinase [Deltaproteobacteria bacterium]